MQELEDPCDCYKKYDALLCHRTCLQARAVATRHSSTTEEQILKRVAQLPNPRRNSSLLICCSLADLSYVRYGTVVPLAPFTANTFLCLPRELTTMMSTAHTQGGA